MYSANNVTKQLSKYSKIYYIKDSLVVETYIIGYKSEGECILFFIKCNNTVVYAGMIDCFISGNTNLVETVLQREKVGCLDFICWTHPDLDHSKGLSYVIEKFTSEKTQIWIPENVEAGELDCSQEVQFLFKKLKENVISKKEKYQVFTASDYKDLLYYNSICFVKDIDLYPLKIVSLAPSSRIVKKQTYLEKFIKNDRSIFMMLELGMANMLFTGDVEDTTISLIPRQVFENQIHLIKIPHHGSDSSKELLKYINDGCDISCATVYRKGASALPLDEVMKEYARISDQTFCTGKKDVVDEDDLYGVIRITTDILNETKNITVEGNADEWK